ncbi:TonB-dependent receptor [Sphingomonas xinjiangensis]|uniref:TonB-dependent receptor n=1 Tax=Sphingomonas xinjiangensis TaxID=643568 RepID=A0A840YCZ6_9SPHN|nr:TonB-dependent receptor [Sphingomonas xinjiangensis]MBB5711267.1 TonB-dependent receptor [Sphingomonas xinjiangensis]
MAFKPAFLCTASVGSLMFAAMPVAAQTAADQTATPAGDAASAQDQAPADEEIVVTGVRGSIVGALNVRRESVQIVDSVVAEDVGKLPDNNVVEALQRVTGIQVTDRAGGEAAAVTIRGLSDPLTTLNGRNIFTAAGTSFALQDVSANLVKQVDVYKTRAADQIETGLAGQIDIKTRRPLDFDGFAISGLARGIYSEQADKINPNVALLVSNRWSTGIGDIGLLVNGSYSRYEYRNQNVQSGALVPFLTADGPRPAVTPTETCGGDNPPASFVGLERLFPTDCRVVTAANRFGTTWTPGLDRGLSTAAGSTLNINGAEIPYYLSRDAVISSDLYGKRERPSVNAALQWAPNSSSVYTAEFFYSGFRGNTSNNLLFTFADWWGNLGSNPGSTFELYDGTNIIKSRRAGAVAGFNSADYATNRTDSYVYALNGTWDVGTGGKITADVTYQDSTNETAFFAIRTSRGPLDLDVDFNAGGGIPAYSFGNPGVLTDPSAWTLGELYDSGTRGTGNAITAMLDGEQKWDDGFLRRIKLGFRYDNRDASTFVRDQGGAPLGTNLTALGEDAIFTNANFFDGRADVPSSWVLPDAAALYQDADALRTRYRAVSPNLLLSDQLSFTRVFDINEINTAAYALADGELSLFGRPLQLQAGVRFVAIDTDYTYFDRTSGAATRVSTGSSKFLPSVTARYELTDNLRLRFNYGETLRRPAFGDLNPNYTLTGDLSNVGFGTGSAGTATLAPTHSKNYDLALEWYFERNSAIYVTAFRREIDGLVVPLTIREVLPNNYLTNNYTEIFNITRPINASDGVLKGVEIGVTYFPNYLPGPLDGLGFTGSATILDSTQTIPVTDANGAITGESESSFFAVSKFSYNATLAYDNGPIGARLSYIWRKGFLNNNEARAFANPIGMWRKPESSLDLQLTWNVAKNIGVTFDAVNLTKSKQQNYYQFGDVGGADQFNSSTLLLDRTFALGVRFSM